MTQLKECGCLLTLPRQWLVWSLMLRARNLVSMPGAKPECTVQVALVRLRRSGHRWTKLRGGKKKRRSQYRRRTLAVHKLGYSTRWWRTWLAGRTIPRSSNERPMKIEVRRMDGATWVKLSMGLAVVPIGLLEELREHWTGKIADALKRGEAVVNVGLDRGDYSLD